MYRDKEKSTSSYRRGATLRGVRGGLLGWFWGFPCLLYQNPVLSATMKVVEWGTRMATAVLRCSAVRCVRVIPGCFLVQDAWSLVENGDGGGWG